VVGEVVVVLSDDQTARSYVLGLCLHGCKWSDQ